MKTTHTKTPAEVLDYDGDWSDELEEGESIVTSNWTLSGTGLVKDSQTVVGSSITKVWLSSGTDGTRYLLKNTITTSDGRTLEDWFYLLIRSAA